MLRNDDETALRKVTRAVVTSCAADPSLYYELLMSAGYTPAVPDTADSTVTPTEYTKEK